MRPLVNLIELKNAKMTLTDSAKDCIIRYLEV